MSVTEVTGAVPGVLSLAAAGGIGLADAATITANAINSFGLEASAAGDVANVFAAAANAPSADVTTLADGFKNAGAVFHPTGRQSPTWLRRCRFSPTTASTQGRGGHALQGHDAAPFCAD